MTNKDPDISADIKLQIADILKEHGVEVAIEVGCTLIEEKTGFPTVVCRRAVKKLIKKFS